MKARFLLICTILLCYPVYAADIDHLQEKSLEELMDMTVTTASKREQKIHDAPAVVTVITARQIEQLGVTHLSEIMSFVPGFTITNSYWRNSMITARGVKQSLYNDKILMLIDGIPVNDAASMEHHLDMIPIGAVKRAEIIRGPGSTLYGTNAFAGVINVITMEDYTPDRVTGFASGGSFDTQELGGLYRGEIKKAQVLVSIQMANNEGYDKVATDETGTTDIINYENDVHSFFTKIVHKAVKFSGGIMYAETGKFGAIPNFELGNMFIKDRGRIKERFGYFNIELSKELSSRARVKALIRYDNYQGMSDIGDAGRFYNGVTGIDPDTIDAPVYARFRGETHAGEGQFSYHLSDNFEVIAGIAGESRKVSDIGGHYDDIDGQQIYAGSVKSLPFDIVDFGGFFQLDGNVTPEIGFVGGLRYSYLGASEKGYITPRGGLIFHFLRNNSIKLLYGEAFRAPSAQEHYMNIPNIVAGKQAIDGYLDPEKIKTTEIALEQVISNKHTFRINAFHMDISQIIARRPTTPQEQIDFFGGSSPFVYDNLSIQEITGIEAEFSGYIDPKVSYFINGVIKDGADASGNDIHYFSNMTASGGISAELFNGNTKVSPNFVYIGEREGKLQSGAHSKVDPYALVNLVVRQKMSDHVIFSITLSNVLDTEYFYPEQVRRNIETIPGGPRRNIFVRVFFQ